MSQAAELLERVVALATCLDDALVEAAAAADRASETVDYFAGLGGSVARAVAVQEVVEALHADLQALRDRPEEAEATLRGIDVTATPETNLAHLSTTVEQLQDLAAALDAGIGGCQDAQDEIHGHLAGSSAADEIAGSIGQAQEHLEEARTRLDALILDAQSQQQTYQAGTTPSVTAAGPNALPAARTASSPGGPADKATLPDRIGGVLGRLPARPSNDRPTFGSLLDETGNVVGEPIRSGRDETLLQDLDLLPRAMKSESLTSHVEAKVAAMIRRGQAPTVATLVINNDRGPCGWLMRQRGQRMFGTSCEENLPDILPVGAVLTVWWRDSDGATRSAVYRGTGKGIKG